MGATYYSAHDLFKMQLPGLPRSSKGIRERAQSKRWPSRTVDGLGGPGGKRIEYQPPPDVQRLIDARINAAGAGKMPAAHFSVQERAPPGAYAPSLTVVPDAPVKIVRRLAAEYGVEHSVSSMLMLVEQLALGNINEAGARCVLQHVKSLLKGE